MHNEKDFVEEDQLIQEATQGNDKGQAAERISNIHKLSDEELEQVSGGTSRKKDIFNCYYCDTWHVMERFYPWKITHAKSKQLYSNATKYVCRVNGTFFTLPLISGGTAYFNANGERLA